MVPEEIFYESEDDQELPKWDVFGNLEPKQGIPVALEQPGVQPSQGIFIQAYGGTKLTTNPTLPVMGGQIADLLERYEQSAKQNDKLMLLIEIKMLSNGKRGGKNAENPTIGRISRAVLKVLQQYPNFQKISRFATYFFTHDIILDLVVDGIDIQNFYLNTRRRIYDSISVFKGVGLVQQLPNGHWVYVGRKKNMMV